MGCRRCLIVVVLAFMWAAPAHAQRAVDLERFRPALDGEGFLGIQATRTPGPLRFNLGLWTSWSTNPLLGQGSDGSEEAVVSHRVTTDLAFQLGIGGRLAVAAAVPLVLYQDADGSILADSGAPIAATAVSDPRIALRYRFLGEDSRVERERNEGGGVAIQLAGTLPVGNTDALASEAGVTMDAQGLADFHVLGAGVGAMLGYRHRFEPQDLLSARFRDELLFGVALKLPIPVTRDFLGILELRGATDAGSVFSETSTAVESDLALRIRRGSATVTGGVGIGLTSGVGSPAFRAMLGIAWAPRVRDADGDTIPDDRDECPYLPEDFDSFEDSDGCLDPDNDNDLIPDADDQCPNVQAEEFRDEDEDGCTDPPADADGDSVDDSMDGCPSQAEDRDGHQDEDGCPDLDDDQDGVPDESDGCRLEPEDQDGFEDADGCPDPDNDGDGTADETDACPNEAEDPDGFEDADGCPDPDNDRDGVLDEHDRCPGSSERINGIEDDDGCPDRGGRALFRVRGEGDSFQIVGVIRFRPDHGIAPGSAGAVEQLARQLIREWSRPMSVAIGSEEPLRAAALREALIAHGVAPGRIQLATDPGLRGSRVVVTYGAVQSQSTQ